MCVLTYDCDDCVSICACMWMHELWVKIWMVSHIWEAQHGLLKSSKLLLIRNWNITAYFSIVCNNKFVLGQVFFQFHWDSSFFNLRCFSFRFYELPDSFLSYSLSNIWFVKIFYYSICCLYMFFLFLFFFTGWGTPALLRAHSWL